jgi:hypothetical protein
MPMWTLLIQICQLLLSRVITLVTHCEYEVNTACNASPLLWSVAVFDRVSCLSTSLIQIILSYSMNFLTSRSVTSASFLDIISMQRLCEYGGAEGTQAILKYIFCAQLFFVFMVFFLYCYTWA